MKKLFLALTTIALLVAMTGCGGGSPDGGVFDSPTADPRGDDNGDDPGDDPNPRHEHKVYVCHKPEDGRSAQHTILIAKSALDHHLGHGDVIGECADNPMPATGRATLCHFPHNNGNNSNAHTIIVGAPAVEHHEGHGDTLGECPED